WRPAGNCSTNWRCPPGSPGRASTGSKTWPAAADPHAQRISPASTPPYSSRSVTRGGSLGGAGLDVAMFGRTAGLDAAMCGRTAGLDVAMFGRAAGLAVTVDFDRTAGFGFATAVL